MQIKMEWFFENHSPEKSNFDVFFLFETRNSKKVVISKCIEIISSHAFSGCNKLEEVEIPLNLKLHVIEDNAFSQTSITSLILQTSFKGIKNSWCDNT